MTGTKFDPIAVIEAAYQLDVPDRHWKEGILAKASPMLDAGRGMVMFEIDATEPDTAPRIHGTVATGPHPELLCDFVRQIQPQMGSREVRRVYRTPFVYATTSERMNHVYEDFRDDPIFRSVGHPHGLYDFQGTQIVDPDGKLLILGAPLERVQTSTEPTKRRWERLSAHIAAAYRLRRTDPLADVDADDVDAVLNPDGTLAEARHDKIKNSAFRQALEEQTRHIERARGGVRNNHPDDAIDLWKALVRGEYSLIEKVDTDGRRFFLARRNAPVVKQPTALSTRESQVVHLVALGHSNQLIAYELGLAESTIATLLSRARRKLNVDSRTDLIELVAALS